MDVAILNGGGFGSELAFVEVLDVVVTAVEQERVSVTPDPCLLLCGANDAGDLFRRGDRFHDNGSALR
jgi:hypothetical protein